MNSDCDLLRRYAETNSEEAFAELVRRHVDLIYSAALRQVNGDAHLARDVAQSVFTDLARRATALSGREVLTGWLYTSTHFAAAKAVRAAQRRRAHEEAARKRVDRALEKLRAFLSGRGFKTSATLATVISTNAVQIAPAGLAGALAGVSLASASAAGSSSAMAALKIMSITKLQAGIVAAVIVAVTTSFVVQHRSQVALEKENESLRAQVAQLSSANETLSRQTTREKAVSPQLPAPALPASTAVVDPNELLQSTNLYDRLKDIPSKLSM